jgi:hypothetical protein
MVKFSLFLALLFVSFTTAWSQSTELTGKIRVAYPDPDQAPDYGVEYYYYKTSSQLVFLDPGSFSTHDYAWDRDTRTITDTTANESYTYSAGDSGTYVNNNGGDGGGAEFVLYDASWDLDYDGTPDGEQIDAGNLPTYTHKIDLSSDSDLDDLTLAQEGVAGTDPINSDTDGDSRKDGAELFEGTSPLKKNFGPYELEWQVDLSETIPIIYGIESSAEPHVNPYNGNICLILRDGSYSTGITRMAILSSAGELIHFSAPLDKGYRITYVAAADTYIIEHSFGGKRETYIYKMLDYSLYDLIPLHESNINTSLSWAGLYESHGYNDYVNVYGWEVYKYKKNSTVEIFTGAASYGVNGENFLIRWSSASGVQYQIQKSIDLVSWENIGIPITGNGVEMQWAEPFVGDSVFYRLALP